MKPKIASIRNFENYLSLSILKSDELLKILQRVLLDIGVNPTYAKEVFAQVGFCEAEELPDPIPFADISEIRDKLYNFNGKGYNVDLVFGADRGSL